jgi:hypothetical protein
MTGGVGLSWSIIFYHDFKFVLLTRPNSAHLLALHKKERIGDL